MGIIAVEKEAVTAHQPALFSQTGQIFKIQLDAVADGIVGKRRNRREILLHLYPAGICCGGRQTGR